MDLVVIAGYSLFALALAAKSTKLNMEAELIVTKNYNVYEDEFGGS